jgi:NADH-quinone oxidoreductase subunit L
MSGLSADFVMRWAVLVAIVAPLLSALIVGVLLMARARWMSESAVARVVTASLFLSAIASLVASACHVGIPAVRDLGNIEYGDWLAVGNYSVPIVAIVDGIALAFSLLAASLTALVARFSRTYLHKEAGFARFFVLLAMFAAGAQLVAFAGALDVFFAGWELIGLSSAMFIGFFHERDEPVRSAVRAFATYRLCDVGLLIAVVTTHEVLGSTRFSALASAGSLPAFESATIAAMFLLSAMGKSAQLPFSGWLPRAMEGPTPSSALFYGAVSIHAGLYLMLRVSPVIEVAPVVAGLGVLVGIATAIYAAAVARVHTDAKGALAHATLSQIGLILAEICLGLAQLAVVHLVCHALLRAYQYLRAPNMIHDVHQHGHIEHGHMMLHRLAPRLSARLYAMAVHRLRLDEQIDQAIAPVLRLARGLARIDARLSGITPSDRIAP